MEDPFELLIRALVKRCDISKNQARVVVDYLDRMGFVDEDSVETHFIRESEL